VSSTKTGNALTCHPFTALVFDVDGTLYRQGAVRRKMLQRLAARTLLHPREMLGVWRALAAYRSAQELMRSTCVDCSSIAEEQIRIACRSTGLSENLIACHVSEWMEKSPLNLLRSAMQDGLLDLLKTAKKKGLKLGVWSDYPPVAKLNAMGLDEYFDVVVAAQDIKVQRFKPDPRGLEVVMDRLGVAKEHTLYIGDRPEVDGHAAARAGVRCIILGKKSPHPEPCNWEFVASYSELTRLIFPH
jgi:putative hydrolase of the HAD superfamily